MVDRLWIDFFFLKLFISSRQRIPKKFVFYHKSALHRGHYILSFAFGFDKEDDVYHYCLVLPYSYNKLQTFLNVIEKKAAQLNESFSRECLTNSVVSIFPS